MARINAETQWKLAEKRVDAAQSAIVELKAKVEELKKQVLLDFARMF